MYYSEEVMLSSPKVSRFSDNSSISHMRTEREVASSTEHLTRAYTLPAWQPDATTAKCPYCRLSFSLWYRKHHCRKCGRVVCDECSRHRIRIPTKYIVQPPETVTSSPFSALLGAAIGQASTCDTPRDPEVFLSNSEVVRVCNPCVPDPNLSPPPPASYLSSNITSNGFSTYESSDHQRTHILQNFAPTAREQTSFRQPKVLRRELEDRELRIHKPLQRHDTITNNGSRSGSNISASPSIPRRRSATTQTGYRNQNRFYHPTYANLSESLINGRYPRPHISGSEVNHRHNALVDSQEYIPPHRTAAAPSPDSIVASRQVAEEDECPVCGKELPPKDAAGEDKARVKHVEDCIKIYSSSASSSTINLQATSRRMLAASEPSMPSDLVVSTLPYRGNRMIIYHATEKDCLAEDGTAQECIICFDEYEPGDEIGRLDCFCKFHKQCIREWWETKGSGSCPTHQLHK